MRLRTKMNTQLLNTPVSIIRTHHPIPTKPLRTLRCTLGRHRFEPTDRPISGGFCGCCCGRRPVLEAIATTPLSLFLIQPSSASNDPTAMLNNIHPPRPDWYEEFYAAVLDKGMKAYENEVSGYKSQIFAMLKGNAKTILEIGIGTGPNLKYYANENDVNVIGIDPNRKMEKYAKTAALASGLRSSSFKFVQGVAEALPLNDASVDAVLGTLVLCSVKDVDATLKEIRRVLKKDGIYLFIEHVAAEDGTLLRVVQGLLDPLQQTLADGCHLTRRTGKSISEAGFSSIDISTAFLSSASLINPHVYGFAQK